MENVNPITEKIKPHVADIEKDAAAGSEEAKTVILFYDMYVDRPDDFILGVFCECAFDKWNAGHQG